MVQEEEPGMYESGQRYRAGKQRLDRHTVQIQYNGIAL